MKKPVNQVAMHFSAGFVNAHTPCNVWLHFAFWALDGVSHRNGGCLSLALFWPARFRGERQAPPYEHILYIM